MGIRIRHKQKRNWPILLLLLLLLLPSAGCWDSSEVEELAMMTLLGFDWVHENGQDQWLVTGHISDPGGGGGETGGAPKGTRKEKIIKGYGTTILEALDDMTRHSSRTPFWGDVTASILGERAAREKLKEFMDVNMRFRESRPRTYVMLTQGLAYDLLQAEPLIDQALSREVKRMADRRTHETGNSCRATSAEFVATLLSPDRDAVTSKIRLVLPEDKAEGSKTPGVVLDGMGFFRGDRLAGWLGREETLGYILITHRLSQGDINIPLELEGRGLTVKLIRSKPKIKETFSQGQVSFQITLKAQGTLYEGGGLNLTEEEMNRIEQAAGRVVEDSAAKAVTVAQEYGADFLGLSQDLHRWHPTVWREIQPSWREKFQQAVVEVQADIEILHAGRGGKKLEIKK